MENLCCLQTCTPLLGASIVHTLHDSCPLCVCVCVQHSAHSKHSASAWLSQPGTMHHPSTVCEGGPELTADGSATESSHAAGSSAEQDAAFHMANHRWRIPEICHHWDMRMPFVRCTCVTAAWSRHAHCLTALPIPPCTISESFH